VGRREGIVVLVENDRRQSLYFVGGEVLLRPSSGELRFFLGAGLNTDVDPKWEVLCEKHGVRKGVVVEGRLET
jgi:hypothetical protein